MKKKFVLSINDINGNLVPLEEFEAEENEQDWEAGKLMVKLNEGRRFFIGELK